MAAVFLHNAIFTAEPPAPPPSAAQRGLGASALPRSSTASTSTTRSSAASPHSPRAPRPSTHHDRTFSSVSSVTLHTATSEHSHPTEPLVHPSAADSASTVYLDLLARQPKHPSSPATMGGLTLQGDPLSARERRVQRERTVRRRLRRLRWVQRALWAVIGAWATYNTVRYYVGAWIHPYRERQVIALVLGSSTALCLTCILTSLIISASAIRLGWYYKPRSKHALLQCFLRYSSSILLAGPAVVNFILVFLWRNTSDTLESLKGRCHWDIDVVWTGFGGVCTDAPAWGFWLAGSLIRLLLTVALVVSYHIVSYQYMVTRRPSRRRHTSLCRHSTVSPRPSTGTAVSARSARPITTSSGSPLPLSPSTQAQGSPRKDRWGGPGEGEPHALRSSRSRILAAEGASAGSSQVVRRAVSAQGLGQPRDARPEPERSPSPPSTRASSEGGSSEEGDYGRPVARTLGGYASVPDQDEYASERARGDGLAWDPMPDADLNTFAAHFRALVEQVARETDAASTVAAAAADGYTREPQDSHFVLGRAIHRMPTIESMGSHEVTSLASLSLSRSGFSRTSTRSNTLDAPHSRSASRANSLDAAVSLSLSLDGLAAAGGERAASEFGELTPSSTRSFSFTPPITLGGTRSTGSYHTAMSTQPASVEEV